MLNCTVSDPTQLWVPEGASGAILGALEGHYVFMCWAPSLCVVEARRVAAPSQWRAREAVQAELDKISPVVATPSVTPEMLQRDREAIAERGGLRARRVHTAGGALPWR